VTERIGYLSIGEEDVEQSVEETPNNYPEYKLTDMLTLLFKSSFCPVAMR